MSIYIISDLHIGHANMASKRGFALVKDHDEHLIKGISEVMTKRDKIYLLGDLSMEKNNYQWLSDIPGVIHVVLGNHDRAQHVQSLIDLGVKASSYVVDKKRRIILSHIPIHPSQLDRFNLNIHGHIHEEKLDELKYAHKYINVSAEVLDYKPVLLDSLL